MARSSLDLYAHCIQFSKRNFDFAHVKKRAEVLRNLFGDLPIRMWNFSLFSRINKKSRLLRVIQMRFNFYLRLMTAESDITKCFLSYKTPQSGKFPHRSHNSEVAERYSKFPSYITEKYCICTMNWKV